ncbi:glycine cleavage h-protein [Ditylenchus destructor]|nr:glycine cleavage h-protein [Ditylenchus destructor]
MIIRLLSVTGVACRTSAVRAIPQRYFSSTHPLFTSDRRYTKKHEWVSVTNDIGTVGISSHAQGELGDVVYVELPEVGQNLQQGDTAGAVESVKAASDIYSPVSGKVVEKNVELETKPHLINKSTYEKGWIFKLELTNKSELDNLMDESAYEKFRTQEQSNDE